MAARMLAAAAPATKAKALCTSVKDLVDMENLLNGGLEVSGDGECERQARVVAALLNGIDGLPGDLEGLGQSGLRQSRRLSQFFEFVAHSRLPSCQANLS